jgi:hypothetical protein
MPDSFEITAPELNRAVYVAVATVKEDPRLDVLAGITYYMLQKRPNLLVKKIREGIAALREAIDASSPDRQFDHSPDDSIYLSRILTRLVPKLTDPNLRAGAKAYTQAFFNSYRRGLDRFRQVASIETHIDRFREVGRFRRDTWEKLYETAVQNPRAAKAINESPIAESLGGKTTQNAIALLEAAPIAPLSGFVSAHLQPGGGLRAEMADIETSLGSLSASALGLGSAYAANLFALNRVEQELRDILSIICPKDKKEEKKTELQKAIEKAKEKQKDLDGTLGDIRSGVKGTLDVFAFLASHSNDEEFAADIKKFAEVSVALLDGLRKYSKNAITTAEKLTGFLKLGTTGFTVISAIGFTGGLIAIGIAIFGILGKKQGPSINEQILRQLQNLSTQIQDLRKEMNVRFDRIEKQLNAMFASMLEHFARIDFNLGQIEGNVEEIQFALYSLHSAVQRMNRNIHTFLEAAHRRELVEAINGFLNFRELTGQDMDFETFLKGENEFFSWGFSHAQDPLQAGPEERSFQDSDLFAELDNFPITTNVNYLRQMPAERFGLPPIAANRLANPSDWITASEGYAQLSEESPAHAANISAERVGNLIDVGEQLGASLSRIADNSLFNALANHYLAQFASLKAAVAAFEREFRNDADNGLAGIDLWGGANQIPKSHLLDGRRDLRRCDNRSFGGGVDDLTTDLSRFDHSELAPYMIAGNLGLDTLDACIAASWIKKSVTPIFGERFNVEFQLIITIRIRYGGSTVFEHRFDSDKTFKRVLLRSELDTFDPNTTGDPHGSLPGLWSRLESFPAKHSLVNPSLRTATIAAVEAALELLQRTFYAQVAQRLAQAGDPVQEAGERLTGSKLLWQSYVVMGLPLSVESNEFLRSLLFGGEAILAGTDAGSPDALLDDLQDIYAFFSSREEAPPGANIIADIEALVNERVETLLATLADIVENINTTGEPEPPELFAPTLLRLSLIESRGT